MNPRSLTAVLAALVAAPASVAAQAPATRYTLKGDSVAVYNLVGELRVEPGPAGDVAVEIRFGGADAAKLKVETGAVRGRESLRVIYPDDLISVPAWGRGSNTQLHVRDDGTFGDGGDGKHAWRRDAEGRTVRITGRGRDGLEAYADLTVRVPAGRRVALHLGVGKAFVSNVDGDIRVDVASADIAADRTRGRLKLETGSGDIDLRDATGDVALETGSGEITAANVRGTRLKLETGSGNVRLTGASAPDLSIETGSGDVDVTGAQGDNLIFETGSGNVDVVLVSTFQTVSIETGSGDVTLQVPPTIGAEVDLDTGSGDIDLGGMTILARRIQRDHVTGTIGDGKGRLSIETGSGNVRLVKS